MFRNTEPTGIVNESIYTVGNRSFQPYININEL